MNIAVVGAGPVGIFFTKLCLDQGHSVTLVEAGSFEKESEHLSKEKYIFNSPSALPENVHKVGGGSTKWRGRISEFLEEDFLENTLDLKPSWPFNKVELKPHYKKVYEFLNVSEFDDAEVINNYFQNVSQKLPHEFFLRSFRFCKVDYFIDLFDKIKDNSKLEFLGEHFCRKIHKLPMSKSLSIELISKDSQITWREFHKVVIACGTLQTTALLMHSLGSLPDLNKDVLGKYLMEHREGFIGTMIARKSHEKTLFSSLCLDERNRAIEAYDGIGVAISLLGQKINVQYEIRYHLPNPNKLEYLKLSIKKIFKTTPLIMKFLLFHVRVATFLSKKLIKVIDTLSQRERYAVYIKAEEKAFSNSTVSLSNYSDNTLTYSHKVSNNTFFLLQESIRVFREIFLNNFKAKLKINRLINNLSSIQYVFGANWHPMGTTRMGLDPKTSVCDANLKVHNVDNLYLLSAAVFPSGSNTNPTMTVLALANRLSENEFSKLN
jgi:hypothetical protein